MLIGVSIVIILMVVFSVFFDQAILVRKDTVYHVDTDRKLVALTFDDGPSPEWTPQILDALKAAGIKATFFMIGYHVQKYPEMARRVVAEGHLIANHGYAHSVIMYYNEAEIEQEIKYTEHVIRETTGVTTKYFRPPKAWLKKAIKNKIKSMGYDVILWSLNSKDWVHFNHKTMVNHIKKHIQGGDILLFHDSGDIFKREGGSRVQTVKAIPMLVEELSSQGYEFVTIEELVNSKN